MTKFKANVKIFLQNPKLFESKIEAMSQNVCRRLNGMGAQHVASLREFNYRGANTKGSRHFQRTAHIDHSRAYEKGCGAK